MERLISDRRVSAAEVNRYLSQMNREIQDLEQRLQHLTEVNGRSKGGRVPSRALPASGGDGAAEPMRRRRRKITPEQAASRQLQGRYLALVRRFPANKRAHFAKVAKEKGREAAIKEMQDSVKK